MITSTPFLLLADIRIMISIFVSLISILLVTTALCLCVRKSEWNSIFLHPNHSFIPFVTGIINQSGHLTICQSMCPEFTTHSINYWLTMRPPWWLHFAISFIVLVRSKNSLAIIAITLSVNSTQKEDWAAWEELMTICPTGLPCRPYISRARIILLGLRRAIISKSTQVL